MVDLVKTKEEEEESKLARNAYERSVNAVRQTSAYQDASVANKKTFERKQLNPENLERGGAQSQQAKLQGKQPSVSDQFFEAIGFFMPTIVGGLVGGAIEGTEGAFEGAKLGMKAGEQFQRYKERQQQLASPAELARLEISKGNLALRKEELKAELGRATGLKEERELRREERDIDRAVKIKEQFTKRKDIQTARENLDNLDTIENLVKEGKKIPGAVLSKIARAISGEVGVLTEQDVARSQVNPDVWSKIKRGFYTTFKGEIPPSDAKEIVKISNVFKKKYKDKIKKKVTGFSKSRSKNLVGKAAATLKEDLLLEFNLMDKMEEEKEQKFDFSREEIEAMKEKLRRNR